MTNPHESTAEAVLAQTGPLGFDNDTAEAAEAAAGITRFRKAFRHIEDSENLVCSSTKDWIQKPTDGDDMVFLVQGTPDNTQGDLTGAEDKYGAGYLTSTVLAGVTSIDVTVEDGANIIFRDGEGLYISDKVNESDVAGNAEFATISGVPVVVGDVVTITLAVGISNGYSSVANATHVSYVLDSGQVGTSTSNVVKTTVSGILAEAQIAVQNVGGTYENVTITFTDATNFTVVGDTLGALAAGIISTDYSPVNPDSGTPYFTILAAAWSGTWAAAETVSFTTNPADVDIWEVQIVPAGTASVSGNNRRRVMHGESA